MPVRVIQAQRYHEGKKIICYGIKYCRMKTATEGREKLVRLIICEFFLLSFSGLDREFTSTLRLHGYGDQIREGPPVRPRDVSSNENINSAY